MAIRIVSYSLAQVRAIPDIRNLPYYPGLERTGNYQRTRDNFKHPIGGVQHIAVAPEDHVGVDSSAEAVTAYGVNLNQTRASWNDCVDRDSYCPLLPPWVRPWQHGVTGMGVDMNEAGVGQEMGVWDTDWNAKPAAFVTAQLRMSAAVWAAWFTAYGWPVKVTLDRARLFELARRGESWGLTSHAVIDPASRRDPGVHNGRDTFPWTRLLGLIKEEQAIRTGAPTPAPIPSPVPAPTPAPGRSGSVFYAGSDGPDVHAWQADLHMLYGGLPGAGTFGLKTTTLTKTHQAVLGVTPDGRVGPATLTAHKEYLMSLETKIDALATLVAKVHQDLTARLDELNDAPTPASAPSAATVAKATVAALMRHPLQGLSVEWWLRRGLVIDKAHRQYPADPGSPADIELRVAAKTLGTNVTPYDGTQKR